MVLKIGVPAIFAILSFMVLGFQFGQNDNNLEEIVTGSKLGNIDGRYESNGISRQFLLPVIAY